MTVSPHHVIPREEGGLPLSDNIVDLCETHHNLIEGPYGSFYDGRQGWGKINAAREDWRAEHRPQSKVHLDYRGPNRERRLTKDERWGGRLEILWRRKRAQTFLNTPDEIEYSNLLNRFDAGENFANTK